MTEEATTGTCFFLHVELFIPLERPWDWYDRCFERGGYMTLDSDRALSSEWVIRSLLLLFHPPSMETTSDDITRYSHLILEGLHQSALFGGALERPHDPVDIKWLALVEVTPWLYEGFHQIDDLQRRSCKRPLRRPVYDWGICPGGGLPP